jgi:2-methylfumaryl-CoA hydratase
MRSVQMSKTNPGNFFEDFTLGQVIEHATPRTVTEGDRAAVRLALPHPLRVPVVGDVRRGVGWTPHPVEELIGFHIAFGKTVPDVSLNAVANLGYAECRFHQAAHPRRHPAHDVRGHRPQGELQRQVRRRVRALDVATDQHGDVAIDWARWVMVHKRDSTHPPPSTVSRSWPRSSRQTT